MKIIVFKCDFLRRKKRSKKRKIPFSSLLESKKIYESPLFVLHFPARHVIINNVITEIFFGGTQIWPSK